MPLRELCLCGGAEDCEYCRFDALQLRLTLWPHDPLAHLPVRVNRPDGPLTEASQRCKIGEKCSAQTTML